MEGHGGIDGTELATTNAEIYHLADKPLGALDHHVVVIGRHIGEIACFGDDQFQHVSSLARACRAPPAAHQSGKKLGCFAIMSGDNVFGLLDYRHDVVFYRGTKQGFLIVEADSSLKCNGVMTQV